MADLKIPCHHSLPLSRGFDVLRRSAKSTGISTHRVVGRATLGPHVRWGHWAFQLYKPERALGIFYYYTKMCMCGIIELGLCFFEFLEHASQVYCSIARRSILGRNYTIQQCCFFERACTPRCILRRARRYAAFAALILEARPSVSCYRNSRVYLEV